ncbi:uncharacterized protein MONOS_7996 [Monocercomonoides exilis]|uniref:uncharacterized protein n=1 Tax=Monocercomonoides exilis TaxID=2049356 RepID=UPI00355A77B3|nr:hypothetical protein MONOS_7996 [Monocercomonoides exilis]
MVAIFRELQAEVAVYLKKLLVAGEARQLFLRSAPSSSSSSSSSSTGEERRSTSPFWRLRSEEKKAAGDDQPSSSSAPEIFPSDASAVVVPYISAAAMDDIERRLRIRSPQSRCVVVKQDHEVMGRGVAVCEVGGIVEKGLSAAGLRMEDVVLPPAAIVLAVLEEREEEEEEEGDWNEAKREKKGEKKREKKMEKNIKEKREVMGMRRKAGVQQKTDRGFAERISKKKKKKKKIDEEQITTMKMVVEVIELEKQMFVKTEAEEEKMRMEQQLHLSKLICV